MSFTQHVKTKNLADCVEEVILPSIDFSGFSPMRESLWLSRQAEDNFLEVVRMLGTLLLLQCQLQYLPGSPGAEEDPNANQPEAKFICINVKTFCV